VFWEISSYGEILLFHLPQLVFPRNPAALNAFHRELPAQRGTRIGGPDNLANRLTTTAFHSDQVSNLYIAEAEQARASWMNVVSAGHLKVAPSAIRHVREAYGEGEMHQLLDRGVLLRL
jgi:hypothetical protein